MMHLRDILEPRDVACLCRSIMAALAFLFLYTPFGARAKSDIGMCLACICRLSDAVGRSEWSAKRERSEREADHERRRAVEVCV